jgi:ABC-2 type transport system ATP-binding protein
VLILDEPVARREFLQDLMEAVAKQQVSVVLSSHLVSDLERICDYLIVLAGSRVRIAGPAEDLLASRHLLSGPRRDPAAFPSGPQVISASHADRQTTLLVRSGGPVLDPSWTVSELGLGTWCWPT